MARVFSQSTPSLSLTYFPSLLTVSICDYNSMKNIFLKKIVCSLLLIFALVTLAALPKLGVGRGRSYIGSVVRIKPYICFEMI